MLKTAEELLADVARGVYECTRYEAEQSYLEEQNAENRRNSHPGHGLRRVHNACPESHSYLARRANVEVYLATEKAVVDLDSDTADMSAIHRAVENAGYQVARRYTNSRRRIPGQ
jgi:copper chaperone CopZ